MQRKRKPETKKREPGAHSRHNVSFGKWLIDKNRLNKNVVSIAYKNLHKAPSFPNVQVSNALKNSILSIVAGDHPDTEDLTDSELKYLQRLITASCIPIKIGKAIGYNMHRGLSVEDATEPALRLKNRFTILTGEITAGNDSIQLRKELAGVINELLNRNLISIENVEKLKKMF
jgi:hypothetical protein